MDVKLYGKPGCKLCAGAEEKLKLMAVPYEKFDIETCFAPHEGWRTDLSTTAMALHCLINVQIPMVLIDGKPYNYTGAMRALKKVRKA